MKHERCSTLADLCEFVKSANDKRGGSKKFSITLTPIKRNGSVSIRFDYYTDKRHRDFVSQIAKEHFAGLLVKDWKLYPENGTADNKTNSDIMDLVMDLRVRYSAMLQNGELTHKQPGRKENPTLFEYVQNIAAATKAQGKTEGRFPQLLFHLKKSGLTDKELSKIDSGYCSAFYKYATSDESGLNGDSPANVCNALFAVLNKAVDAEYLDKNPAPTKGKPKPKSSHTEKHLTTEQVGQLGTYFSGLTVEKWPEYKFSINLDFRVWETCRMYLFSVYTGLRLSDIERMTNDNLLFEGDRAYYVGKIKKTGERTFKPLTQKAVALLRLSEGWPVPFCVLPRQTMHKSLKIVFELAGIRLHFSPNFHSARHTHATILANNGVPVQIIQKSLNHRTPAMAFKYIEVSTAALADALNRTFDTKKTDYQQFADNR